MLGAEVNAMHMRGRISVRQLATLTKPGVYSDGGGLYLRVRNSGSRSWLFICMVRGRRRELGLGSVHDVSLAHARQKAAGVRSAFIAGHEPVLERAAVLETVAADMVTFGAFADSLIDDIEGGFRNDKHRKQWRSTLASHAASLRDVPVADVTTDQVLSVLKPIWGRLPETASRLRGRIERVLDAAKVKGHRAGDNPARWRGHLDLLLPRRSRLEKGHHAALPFAEIRTFMSSLQTRQAIGARALEFAILTASRTGEVIGATWGEVDMEEALWSIPASRMKAGQPHQVPLSEGALSVLRALRPPNPGAGEAVFRSSRGGALSNMSMSMLLRRLGHDAITVHGFRSTFRDWAGETTKFAREDIEMALAHTVGSKAERAYRRGRALGKRRDLMAAWSAYCGVAPAPSGDRGNGQPGAGA